MKSLTIIVAFILTFQCSKKQEDATKAEITNKWVLEELVGFEHSIEGNKGRPVLNINMNDSTYNGHTGCNSYSGKLGFGKSGVKLLPALMTKMACDDKGLENAYMEILHSYKYYKLDGEKLKLFIGDEVIAVFKLEE